MTRCLTGLGNDPRSIVGRLHDTYGVSLYRYALLLLGDPAANVHLYGKGEARPGRKIGHVTRLYR